MNPNDSNVEPVDAARNRGVQSKIIGRRRSKVSGRFAEWLHEQTIPITAKYFAADAARPVRTPIPNLNEIQRLAWTA